MKLNDDCVKALHNKTDFEKEIIQNSGFYHSIKNYNKNFIGFDFDKKYFEKAKSILECTIQKNEQ